MNCRTPILRSASRRPVEIQRHRMPRRHRPSSFAPQKPSPRGGQDAFSHEIPLMWDDLKGKDKGEEPWEARSLPPVHAWKKPEFGDTARGRRQQAEAAGAWMGRREDELRVLSSWKGTGGPWTWRVVDSECVLDRNGFDATRTLQTKPWCNILSGAHMKSGVHEWEVRLTGNTRAMRAGVATPEVSLYENLAWGGESTRSWVITDLGSLWHNEKLLVRSKPFRSSGAVIRFRCDMNAGTLDVVSVNGLKVSDARFENLPTQQGVCPIICFREFPATAEMRHVTSDTPPVDTGPFYNGAAVPRGQIADIPKQPLSELL